MSPQRRAAKMLHKAVTATTPTIPVGSSSLADGEVRYMWTNARKNALRRGIAFEITYEQLLEIGIESGWRCAVTGIEFDVARVGAGVRRPFAPSLDRIQSSGGYTVRNCRLVCIAVNLAMNTWGLPVLEKIARAMAGKYSPMGNIERNAKQVADGAASQVVEVVV